jgi:hypothetical protein
MLDLKLIRDDPERVRERLGVRGRAEYAAALDDLLGLDEERRALISEVDHLRARRNEVSPQVGRLKQAGRHDEAEPLSWRCASWASAWRRWRSSATLSSGACATCCSTCRTCRSGGAARRRGCQRRRARVGRGARVRLRAAAALGARRAARHPRPAARHEDRRQRLPALRRLGRAAGARADQPDARHARARARLHRGRAAVLVNEAAASARATCRSMPTRCTTLARTGST